MVIVYLDLDGGVNGAISGIGGGDTSQILWWFVSLGLFLANDLLGVYADGYAFGQLDGEVLGRPSYVIYNSDVQFFKYFISRN